MSSISCYLISILSAIAADYQLFWKLQRTNLMTEVNTIIFKQPWPALVRKVNVNKLKQVSFSVVVSRGKVVIYLCFWETELLNIIGKWSLRSSFYLTDSEEKIKKQKWRNEENFLNVNCFWKIFVTVTGQITKNWIAKAVMITKIPLIY